MEARSDARRAEAAAFPVVTGDVGRFKCPLKVPGEFARQHEPVDPKAGRLSFGQCLRIDSDWLQALVGRALLLFAQRTLAFLLAQFLDDGLRRGCSLRLRAERPPVPI